MTLTSRAEHPANDRPAPKSSGSLYALAVAAGFVAFSLADRSRASVAFAVTFLLVVACGILVLSVAAWLDLRSSRRNGASGAIELAAAEAITSERTQALDRQGDEIELRVFLSEAAYSDLREWRQSRREAARDA